MMRSSLPDLSAVKRLLIIRLSSIGDVTHALPISAALGEAFPGLEITWVVEDMSALVVTGNPYLHDVIVIPRYRWKLGRWHSLQVWKEYVAFLVNLRRRRFDVTLDLQGYAKSALIALATGARYRLGWSRMRDGAGLVSRALPRRAETVHRVDWFLDVARALGVDPDPVQFPLFVPETARRRASSLLCLGDILDGRRYAVLNPAVGDTTRRWSPHAYAALARGIAARFGLPCVLIGSYKDERLNELVRHLAIGDAWPFAEVPAPVNLASATDLKELAALLERAAVHVCGDTGSAHIAAAVGCPVLSLYGPTDPAHAGPWGQARNVLSMRDLCSAQCTLRQCAALCPLEAADAAPQAPVEAINMPAGEAEGVAGPLPATGVARCLAAITPEYVLDRMEQVLHGARD